MRSLLLPFLLFSSCCFSQGFSPVSFATVGVYESSMSAPALGNASPVSAFAGLLYSEPFSPLIVGVGYGIQRGYGCFHGLFGAQDATGKFAFFMTVDFYDEGLTGNGFLPKMFGGGMMCVFRLNLSDHVGLIFPARFGINTKFVYADAGIGFKFKL